ncbi:hypothetical protein LX64_02321 [Chitinophaga skermanii]|uniref:Uncharacterized protein n=2 Tax=Chitinophaga skermanii TaxID=331697 RepID=A0A327QTU2_9BACT|nr:hypothetical protein LX64_02321 [Chitinophaga skermanii]
MASYFLLLLTLKMMALPLLLLEYNLNQAYIAANLCENKNKPQMHCNGKCHLKKQLNKATEVPGTQGEKESTKTALIDYCDVPPVFTMHACPTYTQDFTLSQDLRSAKGFCGAVFRPPIA